ncbi:MAG: glycosyltransferase [Acidobacteriota bacterium]
MHLQSLRPGQIGGLEGYVRHVLAAVRDLDPSTHFVLFCTDYNQQSFADHGWETQLLTAEAFAALDAQGIEPYELDAWFCPLLVLEPEQPGLPTVVNIPDLQHETFPEFFTPEILAWRRQHYARTVAAADRILTLSEFSKQQIVERLAADPERVVATHLDGSPSLKEVDAAAREEVQQRYGLPSRFFFYPGASWPHKNHETLFAAFAELRERLESVPSLVLTGAQVESAVDLASLSQRFGIVDQVQILGYVPEEHLAALYQLSLATVFPSRFEGFGIPVVEAMRLGSPVICSTAASLPEVGGDAVVPFDPTRADELCARLAAFCSDDPEAPIDDAGRRRSDLVAAGRRRAREFSWRRTAEATLATLQDAIASRTDRIVSPAGGLARAETSALPLISVVTPSFNQQPFIERTIRSVLDGGYSPVEHLVIDAASTDGTVEVLERSRAERSECFDFVSEPDRGQAHAVNKGLDRARGEIIGWLNSDDTYEPGCLQAVAETFRRYPECDVVYGRAHYIGEQDELLGVYPTRTDFHWPTLAHECFICQPTVFLRRRVLDAGYRLDDALQMCMDYDFWIRLGERFEVRFIDQVLANSRMYEDNKTVSRRDDVYREVFATVKKHYRRLPFSWALGRAHHLWDRGDPFFNERRLTWLTYLVAGALLVRHNWSQPAAWPSLGREVWVPVKAHLAKRWRLLKTRDSTI